MGNMIDSPISATKPTKALEYSVEFRGRYIELENRTFGIFKSIPNNPMNVRFFLAQNTFRSTGSFRAICNIFRIRKLVNVRMSYEGLYFQVGGKLYNLYDATMNCSSRLLSWKRQVFHVEGRFETKSEGTDLVGLLKRELDSYTVNLVTRAIHRLKAADQTVKRAYNRLGKVMFLKSEAASKVHQKSEQYSVTKENLEFSQKYLLSLEDSVSEYSKDVGDLKSGLNSLCEIKQCPEVCQEGELCTSCYEDIIGNVMGVCPATCYKTKQHRIPPLTEIVECDKKKCNRIHNTNGFFKSIFGNWFGGIIKRVISFGLATAATVFGRLPAPVASGVANGLVTLVDRGRVDEALCVATKGVVTGLVGGLSPVSQGVMHAIEASVRCQRPQRDGYWKCTTEKVKCTKGRHEYKYEHIPYTCEKSCMVEKITNSIPKTCCRTVACASLSNTICVAGNAFCSKERMKALEKISNTNSKVVTMLKKLEGARRYVSFWKIRKHRYYNQLRSALRWLNSSQEAIRSLEKAYNATIESRKKMDKLLSKSLQIKLLLNDQLIALEKVKLNEIRFKAKVSVRNDNYLLPIDIKFQVNRTLRVLSTVLDFKSLNTSLKNIAKDIVTSIVGYNHMSNSRKRRSLNIRTLQSNMLISSVKKYHSYCAMFTNYHQILYDVASSLFNLSSEVLSLHEKLPKANESFLNITNVVEISTNQTMAANFGLGKSKHNFSGLEILEVDQELSEVMMLREETFRQRYEPLNSTTKLLVFNWHATMEDMFNSSRLAYDCAGMNDCMVHILDSLLEIIAVIETERVDHIQNEVKYLETALRDLSNPVDISIDQAAGITPRILNILGEIRKHVLKVVCAKSPNITQHPNCMNELDIGKDLALYCNASGTDLRYSWTFNNNVLETQRSNVLIINNATVSDSGSYKCEVSNHIAKVESIPAVVIVHEPPIISIQPDEYLPIVLSEDDFLHCEVKDTLRNISYQWWFKPANSSSFTPMKNETFPYLNFSPMKTENEGWYFCKVSNSYGETLSRKSFVKGLAFTLPVPAVDLSFSVIRRTSGVNSRFVPSNTTGYDDISSHILTLLSSDKYLGAGMQIKNLRPIRCQLEQSKNMSSVGVGECIWKFHYVGRNMTSNLAAYDNFKTNARNVINATLELKEDIGKFARVINNDSLSFLMAGNEYFVERNSIAVQKFSLTCPKTQSLVEEDFKCGKWLLI
jgi:hypothetical protein